ncbi:hypothetical protein [Rhodohalobacter sp. 8-1]|uniref:hypothetical protein n=1 Tax=Rhodohalobacter sp. 8-1 TaxID=3131972 RepID=UPI0030EC64F9
MYRKVRITLVPGLSTNGIDAPRYNAKYSLNLLAGYHGGLDGYELGLVNINRYFSRGLQIGLLNASGGEMNGIQLAGAGNLSSGHQQGIQISGMGNVSGSGMQGMQFAGFGNISSADMQGMQAAGLMNIARDMQGLQFAGIGNLSGSDMQGIQFAGIFNATADDAQGLLFSGITNISGRSTQGIVMSGITNISSEFQGIGGAGIINISRDFQGIQFAGIANVADQGQGIQIGLVNLAREFEGVPVGIVSYYGNGRKNLDLWFSDGGFTHLGLTLGTNPVYNKVSIGFNPLIGNRDVWSLSWSIGSYRTLDDAWNQPKLRDYFSTHDFTFQRIFDGSWSSTPNAILSYKYLLGKNITPKTALYIGPTANLQVSKQPGNSDYTWYSISEATRASRDVRVWIGFTAGVRIFGQ